MNDAQSQTDSQGDGTNHRAPHEVALMHSHRCGNSRSRNNNQLKPVTARSATQAAGVSRSHGDTINAAVAMNPASTASARFHLFCHNGQSTKNGATNNSWPLNIAPVA